MATTLGRGASSPGTHEQVLELLPFDPGERDPTVTLSRSRSCRRGEGLRLAGAERAARSSSLVFTKHNA